ncbi:MAG: hypothetical protein J6Z49_09275 [Kiritimatiellae bacterium]|nr:hypothetical protein [Kiritimatiellia bacterium]
MRGKLQIAVLSAFLALAVSAAPFDFDAAWRRADAAISGRHPKTAVRELSLIEGEAVARHRWDVAVRCAIRRMEVSRRLENVPVPDLLSVYSSFADAAPEPMQPALRAILAHRYWETYCENHPLVGQRNTVLEDDEGDDPARWSLERAASEVRRCFDAAFSFADELKRGSASEYADLLAPVPDGNESLPTLFDRLALDAIAFDRLFLDEKPLDASGYALGPAAVFCAHPPETGEDGPAFRAVRLFQTLLSFHERDRDRRAFEEIDFNRLQFCYAASRPGEVRERRYADALEQLAARARRYEVASRADALRAQLAVADQKPGLAHMIASRGAAAHPDSPGGKLCAGLVWELEQPSFSLEMERVWCEPWPEIAIRYRNLREVVFSLYPLSFTEMCALSEGTMTWRHLLSGGIVGKQVKAWTQDLPPCSDYQERTFTVTVPKDLPKGLYALIAKPGHPFDTKDTPVLGELVCVSDCVLLTAPSLPSGEQRGYLLRAKDGEPIADAEVEIWRMERGARRSVKIAVLRTAANGAFSFKGLSGNYLFRATAPDGVSVTWSPISVSRAQPKKNAERVSLFTDRVVYKPGQSIHVAGVVTRVEGSGWQAVTNRSVTVSLSGPDTVKPVSVTLQTDAFGTFRYTFDAPHTDKDAVLRIAAGKHVERRIRLLVSERRSPGFHPDGLSIDEEVKRFKEGFGWQASLSVPKWLPSDSPISFKLAVSTRAGKPGAARGTLKLCALKRPLGITRPAADKADADLFNEWEDGEELATQTVAASSEGTATGSVNLKPGVYRFRFETTDPARNRVTNETAFCVFDPNASRFAVPVADFLAFSDTTVRPGQNLRLFWGTGYEHGRCLFSVYDGATLLSETWSREGTTQGLLEIPVTERMHGPLVVNTSFLYGNRFYSRRRVFPLEHPDKVLNLSLASFNERLLPGGTEKWAFSVTDAKGHPRSAEIVSFLVSEDETANLAAYLDSLPAKRDAASPWKWQGGRVFAPVRRGMFHEFQNLSMDAFHSEVWQESIVSPWKRPFLLFRRQPVRRHFPAEETSARVTRDRKRERTEGALTEASPETLVHPLPAIQSGEETDTVVTFTAPSESGRWRLLAFAHDAEGRVGRFDVSGIETVKPLSLSVKLPDFLRKGDEAVCPGIVQNNTAETQAIRLSWNAGNALSRESGKDEAALTSGENHRFTMKLRADVPDLLVYRATVKSTECEESAEGVLPVLPALGVADTSRIVPLAGELTQKLEFNPLLVSDESDTLCSRELTVRVFATPRAAAKQMLNRFVATKGDGSSEDTAARACMHALLNSTETNSAGPQADGEAEALRALARSQLPGGMWAWFPGGEGNVDVTLEVAGMLARLQQVTGKKNAALERVLKSLEEMPARLRKDAPPDGTGLSATETACLYFRSIVQEKKQGGWIRKTQMESRLTALREGWTKLDRLSQARAALVLLRSGDAETARKIGTRLQERLSDEMAGWERTPYLVETLATELELFQELRDTATVKNAAERLLVLKDGEGWGTPGASAAALYALLRSATDEDEGEALNVSVRLGNRAVEWSVATNGMCECVFPAGETTSELGAITVQNGSTKRRWLELHWRFEEDARKLSAGDGTLAVRRRFFIRPSSVREGTLLPFRGEAENGMEIVTRLELESERPRSRLCVVEDRPACLQPLPEDDGWRMRKGVRYYKTTGTSETRFYIENLPKGTFVLETTGRITAQGLFHGGELHVDGIRLPGILFHIRE